jgi:hypothetical protein
MHPRLFNVLWSIWEKRGKPTQGQVFLNGLLRSYGRQTTGLRPTEWHHMMLYRVHQKEAVYANYSRIG